MDYFLTMDYKLKNVVDRNKQRLALAIVTPQELLRQEMLMLGFFKSVPIIVRAFRFARRELAFPEGVGWK